MLFNSMNFVLFFPVAVMGYFLVPQKVRNAWLLACSYYFYMGWNAKYALLILTSTLITYTCGLMMENIEKRCTTEKILARKKVCIAVSLVLNLGILVFFKYFGFLIENANWILGKVHVGYAFHVPDILLPVGISFYIFQALGYTIDVYRKEIGAEKNFIRYALFVSFFPQLVAGPIERSGNLLTQLNQKHKFTFDNLKVGSLWILWGYFLKLVIADRVALIVDRIYGDTQSFHGELIVVATILFSVQIYCDFNGYTMIARGCAKVMGIELMENFNAPYLARTVSEFWRRWHISLSGWFRDYLYIPLGGNRKGKVRKYINLLVVFGISGLWHGAAWGYVIWGLLNGFYQIVGDILTPIRKWIADRCHIDTEAFSHRCLQKLTTYGLVTFSWIFFRAKTAAGSITVLRSMMDIVPERLFDGTLYNMGVMQNEFYFLILMILIVFLVDVFKYRGINLTGKIMAQGVWLRYVVYLFLFWCVILLGIYGDRYEVGSFIYFQF